ncbi:MAG: hypothetical protein BWZ10_00034 [candidate division BRC1 bacterium ADurb.BinA364]|nr:MAG: hypothetical protein BWZ10_00034 [candidate division BRC1 bacterium ADurb.BinA364]
MMDKRLYLKIQRPSDTCIACGAALKEMRKHLSAIREEGEEGVQRSDFCQQCWGKLQQDEEFSSFWLAKREPVMPRNRISRSERNALLLAYFEHYARMDGIPEDERSVRDRLEKLYFMAHLLMRFRIFRWKRTDTQTGMVYFENASSNEEWAVEQTELSDEATLRIKTEIEDYLSKGQSVAIAL